MMKMKVFPPIAATSALASSEFEFFFAVCTAAWTLRAEAVGVQPGRDLNKLKFNVIPSLL
jgi:hypothetical protein